MIQLTRVEWRLLAEKRIVAKENGAFPVRVTVVLFFFSRIILFSEGKLERKKVRPFSLVKMYVSHVQKKLTLSLRKTLTSQNGVLCCCGFSLGTVTFPISSSRLLQWKSPMVLSIFCVCGSKTLEIVEDFARFFILLVFHFSFFFFFLF